MSITRFSSLSYLITVILCKWRWAECLSYNDYRNVQTSIGRRSYAVDNRFYPNSRKIWRRPPQFRDVGDFNGGFPPAIAPVFDAPTFSNFAPQSQSNFPQSQQFNYGGANQLQQQQNYQPQQAPYQPPQSSFQRQQQPYQQQYQNVQPTYRQPQSPSGYGGSYGPSCSPQTSSGNTYGGSSYGSGSVGGSITYGGSAYFPVLPQIDLSRCFTRYTETEIRGYQGFFVAASANIEECLAMCLASAVNYEGQICASIVFIPKNHSCELFNITGRNPPAILYMKYGHDYYEPTNCPGCYIGVQVGVLPTTTGSTPLTSAETTTVSTTVTTTSEIIFTSQRTEPTSIETTTISLETTPVATSPEATTVAETSASGKPSQATTLAAAGSTALDFAAVKLSRNRSVTPEKLTAVPFIGEKVNRKKTTASIKATTKAHTAASSSPKSSTTTTEFLNLFRAVQQQLQEKSIVGGIASITNKPLADFRYPSFKRLQSNDDDSFLTRN